MKRRYDGDDDGYGSSKRHRGNNDEDVSRSRMDPVHAKNNLRKLITRAGEDSSLVHFTNITKALLMELPEYQDTIVEYFYRSITELTSKTQTFAILTGLMNMQNPAFVESLLMSIQEKVLQALEDGEFTKVKLLVRFVCLLPSTKVVSAADVVEFLSAFTYALGDPDAPPAYTDLVCFWLLGALAWSGGVLEGTEGFDKILADITKYTEERKDTYDSSKTAFHHFLPRKKEEEEEEEADLVTQLAKGVFACKDEGWKVASLPPIDEELGKKWEEAKLLSLLPIELPALVAGAVHPPLPARLRLFDFFDRDQKMPVLFVDRFIINDLTRDLTDAFYPEPQEAAKRLTYLPISVPREYMTVEALLSILLELPTPKHKASYYSMVLINLAKTDKAVANYAPALGKAFATLFNQAHRLDVEILDRFSSHFSLHLSNFDWKWPWTKWSHVLDAPADDPQRLLVSDMLQKCEWLTYRDRLAKTVPEDLKDLLPVEVRMVNPFEEEETSADGGEDEDRPATPSKLFKSLVDKMSECRKEPSAILAWIENELPQDSAAPGLRASLVASALIFTGKCTMSYLRTLMQRYRPLLQKVVVDHADRLAVLTSIVNVAGSSPQMVVWTIGKLQALGILTAPAIIDWLFSPDAVSQFTRFYIWLVLDDVLERLSTFDASAQAQLEKARMEDDEDLMARCERKCDGLSRQLSSTYSLLFERFQDVLRAHLAQFEEGDEGYLTPWFLATLNRLRIFGRKHQKALRKLGDLVKEFKLGEEPDARIRSVFLGVEACACS